MSPVPTGLLRLARYAAPMFLAASTAVAQTPNASLLPTDPREQAIHLVNTQLNDTSAIQRAVALHILRRASVSVRREAARLVEHTLQDTVATPRGRALAIFEVLGSEASPLVATVVAIANDSGDNLREYALELLGDLGEPGEAGEAALRAAARDSNEDVSFAAADALRSIGDEVSAATVYRGALTHESVRTRLWAARALAEMGDPVAVGVLRRSLSESDFWSRAQAASALGILGPRAREAVPDLIAMVQDTTPQRIPQGGAWVMESAAPFAAWALSQILPFRSAASNQVIDPLHVRVKGVSNSLRDDGLGIYAWGVDSVAAFRGSGLFLVLSSIGEARGPIGNPDPSLRRFLSFDLSNPVPGGGGRPLGVISDNEAYIWIWFKRDPETDRVTTFREIAVSDSIHQVERIEMHFRVNGVLHELQMGPFVEGQGGAGAWYTGVHGDGTTMAQFLHPANGLWIVRAPAGSVARLWSFENRARPVDRGTYVFSLDMEFLALPGAPNGACVPVPSTCRRRRE